MRCTSKSERIIGSMFARAVEHRHARRRLMSSFWLALADRRRGEGYGRTRIYSRGFGARDGLQSDGSLMLWLRPSPYQRLVRAGSLWRMPARFSPLGLPRRRLIRIVEAGLLNVPKSAGNSLFQHTRQAWRSYVQTPNWFTPYPGVSCRSALIYHVDSGFGRSLWLLTVLAKWVIP